MNQAFALFLFVGSATALGVFVWLGWRLRKSGTEAAVASTVARIELVGLIGASVTTIIALVGAYYTFFTPFSPQLAIGAYSWRVRPEGSPNQPVEVALWLSAYNRGVTPGQVTDLIAVMSFPRGDWLLQPMFFLDSQAYLELISNPQDSPGLPPATEPFGPIALASYAQVSRAVLLMPFAGKANRQWLEPGVHRIRFYARYPGTKASLIAERKIVFDRDTVENWRKGTTIAGVHFESDRPAWDVLRDSGVTVRLK